jgi:hypothetical protein
MVDGKMQKATAEKDEAAKSFSYIDINVKAGHKVIAAIE